MKRSLRSSRLALSALLFCCVTATVAFGTEIAPWSEILLKAQELSGTDEERQAALEKLRAYPRAKVVEALREGLRSSDVPLPAVMRAATELKVRELLPELRRMIARDASWVIVAAVNSLAKDEKDPKERASLAKLYKDRLSAETELPGATRLALLDGLVELKEPISGDLYADLLADKSNSIVESAVHHFLATRAVLSKDDQIKRFKLAFRVRPTMARLEALDAFGALKPEDKKSLRPALSAETCAAQADKTTKELCERVARASGIAIGEAAK